MSSKPVARPRPPERRPPCSRRPVDRAPMGRMPPSATPRSLVRDVVDEERRRLSPATGADPRDRRTLADQARDRLRRPTTIRGCPRDQRDRGDPPHEPRPSAVAACAAAARPWRCRASDYGCLELDRTTRPPRPPLPRRRGPPRRPDRRRGCVRHDNNAAALALAVGLAGRGGRRRLARRAGRDRRRRPDPRDHPAGRARGWSRSGRRTGPARRTSRRRWPTAARAPCSASTPRTSRSDRVHRGARSGRGRRPRPRARRDRDRRSRAPARCSTRRASAWPTSRCPRERLAAGRRPRHVQRRQARRRAAGRADRRAADLVARMRRDPLARAMRPDKATLAGVAATLGLYRAGRATTRHPGLADDRAHPGRARRAGARRSSRRADRSRPRSRSSISSRPSAAARCPARRCRRSASPSRAVRDRGCSPALRRASPTGHRRAIEDGRGRARPADGRRRSTMRRARGARIARPSPARRAMTVVIGTAGHIDHGKTTLLRALTGIDADRLPEERRRGHDDRRRLRASGARRTGPSSTSSTSRATTGWSATCSSARARSMRRCSSSRPTTGRARRPSSISSCSTRSGSGTGSRSSRRPTPSAPERTAEVVGAVARCSRRRRCRLAGRRRLGRSTGAGVEDAPRARASAIAAVDRGDGCRVGRPPLAIDRVFAVKGRGVVVTGTLRGGPLARGATLRLVPGDAAVRGPRDPGPRVAGRASRARRSDRAQPRGRRGAPRSTAGMVLTADPRSRHRPDPRARSPAPSRIERAGRASTRGRRRSSGRRPGRSRRARPARRPRRRRSSASRSRSRCAPGDRFVLRRGGPVLPVGGARPRPAAAARPLASAADAGAGGGARGRRRRPAAAGAPRPARHRSGGELARAMSRRAAGPRRSPRRSVGPAPTSPGAVADVGRAGRCDARPTVRRGRRRPRGGRPSSTGSSRDGRLARDGDAVAAARRRGTGRGRIRRWPRRWTASSARSSVPTPPALAEAARAAGCPPDGRPRSSSATGGSSSSSRTSPTRRSTYRDLAATALALAAPRPADAGGVPRRDRHEPQVRHGDPRGPRPPRRSCDGRRPATCPGREARRPPRRPMTAPAAGVSGDRPGRRPLVALRSRQARRAGRRPADARPTRSTRVRGRRHRRDRGRARPTIAPPVPAGVRVVHDARRRSTARSPVSRRASPRADPPTTVLVVGGDMPALVAGGPRRADRRARRARA